MVYTIYRITNLINNKVYIGAHQTEDVNDGYMGSGTLLKKAIKKYGLLNFKKKIIEYCKNSKDMFKRESEIVDQSFVDRCDTYNLRPGG